MDGQQGNRRFGTELLQCYRDTRERRWQWDRRRAHRLLQRGADPVDEQRDQLPGRYCQWDRSGISCANSRLGLGKGRKYDQGANSDEFVHCRPPMKLDLADQKGQDLPIADCGVQHYPTEFRGRKIELGEFARLGQARTKLGGRVNTM